MKPWSGTAPTPDAEMVAPLVHTIVIASCMSAPVFSEACVTAKTARGVSPVTLNTHAKVCES